MKKEIIKPQSKEWKAAIIADGSTVQRLQKARLLSMTKEEQEKYEEALRAKNYEKN